MHSTNPGVWILASHFYPFLTSNKFAGSLACKCRSKGAQLRSSFSSGRRNQGCIWMAVPIICTSRVINFYKNIYKNRKWILPLCWYDFTHVFGDCYTCMQVHLESRYGSEFKTSATFLLLKFDQLQSFRLWRWSIRISTLLTWFQNCKITSWSPSIASKWPKHYLQSIYPWHTRELGWRRTGYKFSEWEGSMPKYLPIRRDCTEQPCTFLPSSHAQTPMQISPAKGLPNWGNFDATSYIEASIGSVPVFCQLGNVAHLSNICTANTAVL